VTDPTLTEFSRQRIQRLAEDALKRAGVADVFPTPMQAVQRAVDIRERIDVAQLPSEVRASKPSIMKRILGAVWFEERTVFIDTSQPEPRQLFTDGHEATHAMCAWHKETMALLDTEDELMGRRMLLAIENEANFGSGALIFQNGRFHRQALENQVSIRAPLELARSYGASRQAAVHYYAQQHPDAVALLIAGRYEYTDGTIPIWQTVESATFGKRFGRLTDSLPNPTRLKVVEAPDAPLAGIVRDARLAVDPPETTVTLIDRAGRRRTFVAEAFFNGYVNLVLLSDRRARILGRRTRLAS
jgi:hypothetical protein